MTNPQATVYASRTRSGWKLKIILNTVGIAAVVIWLFTFRIEAGLIALGLGASFVARLWFQAVDSHGARRLELRRLEADVRIVEAKARQEEIIIEQMVLAARFHEMKIGVFYFRPGNSGDPLYYPATANERRTVGLIEPPQAELQAASPLMPLIERETCLCFFGPRGSGKTSIALNWLSRQSGSGLIFDPKGRELNLWPERFEVVSDVSQMIPKAERFMAHLERYRQARRIKPSPFLFFVDELKYLESRHGVNLLPFVMDVAMFGREYNFHSGFTTQATTMKHLDINAASLLDNFVVVRAVELGGMFKCYAVGLDGRETEYLPPPAYPRPAIAIEDLDHPPEDGLFIQDCKSGMSQNQLIEKYFSGMRRVDAIEAVKSKKAEYGLN